MSGQNQKVTSKYSNLGLFCCTLLFIITLLASCSDRNHTSEGGETFTHNEGFSVKIPYNSTVSTYEYQHYPKDRSILLMVSGPANYWDKSYFINIRKYPIESEEALLSAANWFRNRHDRRMLNSEDELYAKFESRLLDSQINGWMEKYSTKGIINKDIYILRDTDVLIISFTAFEAEFESNQTIFEDFLDSIEFQT